jgi:hypothetical protein
MERVYVILRDGITGKGELEIAFSTAGLLLIILEDKHSLRCSTHRPPTHLTPRDLQNPLPIRSFLISPLYPHTPQINFPASQRQTAEHDIFRGSSPKSTQPLLVTG